MDFEKQTRILDLSNWEFEEVHVISIGTETAIVESRLLGKSSINVNLEIGLETWTDTELSKDLLHIDKTWASLYYRPTEQNPKKDQDREHPRDFHLGVLVLISTSSSDQKPPTNVIADIKKRAHNQNTGIAEAWKANIQREICITSSLNLIKNYINLPPPKV